MQVAKITYTVLAIAVLYLCAGSNASVAASFPPLPEALEAMESTGLVTVSTVTVTAWGTEENYYYEFKSKSTQQDLGFIIYPGAYVDPRSYAPAAQKIAKAGYLVVIVKMPGDIANPSRAKDVILNNPDIQNWVIGGHSLGGVCACSYIYDNPNTIKGLVLWASYPALSITDFTGKVLSVYGTKDGLSTPAKIDENKYLLPAATLYMPIQGGNHTYFGWYDTEPDALQPGDNPADITRVEQQNIIVDETLKLLDGISGRIPCSLTLTPGTISKFLSLLNPIRRIVISGEDNATFSSDPEVLWSTDGIKTISVRLKDNKTIIAWVRVRPFKLQANETCEMAVGGCIGTLTVKPF